MHRISRRAALALLLLTFAVTAIASPTYVQVTVKQTYSILGGGEFSASILGGPTIAVFCDDYQNYLTATGSYGAYISTAPDLAADSRFGSTLAADFQYQPGTSLSALDRYTMAAWLTTQYTFPSTPTANDLAIQTAIWTLLAEKGAASVPTGADKSQVDYWLSQAVGLKTSNISLFNTIQTDLRVVTSADVANATNRYLAGQQEFIYLTPEPTTVVLAGCGLAALALFRRRRG